MRGWIKLCICLFVLTGCASTSLPREESDTLAIQTDPLEKLNRVTFAFNDQFDAGILQPVARLYDTVTPNLVQIGVGNFFSNIGDVWIAFNSLLQGEVNQAVSDMMRVAVNSTFGLFGLLDVASEARLSKHDTNLGQTLAIWGVPNGPYFVIPFLGPSVIRDTLALPIDYYGDPWSYVYPVSTRNTGTGLRLINKRAAYLDSSDLLEEAALDKYTFVRDAYLQRHANKLEERKKSRSFWQGASHFVPQTSFKIDKPILLAQEITYDNQESALDNDRSVNETVSTNPSQESRLSSDQPNVLNENGNENE